MGREWHLLFRRKLGGKRLKGFTEPKPSLFGALVCARAIVDADEALGTVVLAAIHRTR